MKTSYNRRPASAAWLLALIFPLTASAGVPIDQYPLTVAQPPPPNILFILDDSGSMQWGSMCSSLFSTCTGLSDPISSSNINYTTYTRNTLAYDPHIDYQPWYDANGMKPYMGMNASKQVFASSDTGFLTSPGNIATSDQCFHVPQSGTTDNGPTTSYTNLDRWKLNRIANAASPVTASKCSANATCTSTAGCTNVTSFEWTRPDGTVITRSIEEEWNNYANWYHYYRTRMKAAKASASRAFYGLDEKYRVGFVKINDAASAFTIPTADNSMFRGSNRTDWYNKLLATGFSAGGTPLRAALDRAGQYFTKDAPYKTDGVELSCRQNFAILTTDGLWNQAAADTSDARRNVDGETVNTYNRVITGPNGESYQYQPVAPYKDNYSNTLADVAMYYWKNDLRPNLPNRVPTTSKNPAFWQHMRTFGISIGQRGTLDPNMSEEDLKNVTWPQPSNDNAVNIDDLFHAAVNSRGQFIVASDPEAFAKALQDSLAAISAEAGTLAGGAASSPETAGALLYYSSFDPATWSGNVTAYQLDSATGAAIPNSGWDAQTELPAWNDRNIYFNSNGSQSLFTWGNLSTAQQAALGSESIVDYLRGDQSLETTGGNGLRHRDSVLGSFINSQVIYVGAPSSATYYAARSSPGANTYGTFANNKANRAPMLYVGGSDGMLHAFSAATGEEVYAFIPAAAINAHLRDYAENQDYEHHYFVDGELTASDVYLSGQWKTVLVGTMGRGGRSVFALDVTDPNNIEFLWEKTADDVSAIGNTLGKPIIVQVASGQWRALFGNGPNSDDDKAQLVMLDIADGGATVVDTAVAGDNGLSAVDAWDTNSDGYFETAYAGDLKGNLWRFSNLGGSPQTSKLFTTANNRPISAAPLVTINPKTGDTWVFFGTGSYLSESDRSSTARESWYGLIDNTPKGTHSVIQMNELLERRLTKTEVVNGVEASILEYGTESEIVGAGKRGWYIQLTTPPPERMIVSNYLYGSALVGITFIPDGSDPCSPGGDSAVWGINPFTGGRLNKSFFVDVDRIDNIYTSRVRINTPLTTRTPFTLGQDEGTLHLGPDEDPLRLRQIVPGFSLNSWREIIQD